MPDSEFIRAFNQGNATFAKTCGEDFEVEPIPGQPGKGVPGTYTANSIDDLTTGQQGVPGGTMEVNQVHVYLDKQLRTKAKITEGSILRVRGSRVRVASFGDAGDNKIVAICTKVGLAANVG